MAAIIDWFLIKTIHLFFKNNLLKILFQDASSGTSRFNLGFKMTTICDPYVLILMLLKYRCLVWGDFVSLRCQILSMYLIL